LEKHILSKSTFLRGLQCPKSLYLYKNYIQLRDPLSTEQQAIFNRGNNVGLLARKLFPGGTDATPPKRSDNLNAVENTRQLIRQGAEVIYEAAFQHEQVLAILDILVKKEGKWYGYEVKSSTRISQTYLYDASLQYWVITGTGLPLEDISLITINNQYVRKGALELDQLFAFRSVKKEALANHEMITEKVNASKSVLEGKEIPYMSIGEQCFQPYSCDFMGNCWQHVPQDSIFDISGIKRTEQFALFNAGYHTIREIPANNQLDKNANIHIDAFKKNKVVVDKAAITAFLGKVRYPLFFMDFETFMPAVPVFEGTKPYQHLPFQYSLHYIREKDGAAEHFEFLAEEGKDPRKAFLENLLSHTRGEGSILVYDNLMEKNVLKGLKADFPEFAAEIDNRLSRIVDLSQPFQERSYYHPAMKNSFSIKNLLPALVPELNYSDLKISSGSIAMTAYEGLHRETDMFRILEIREQLLAYCRLDTLAMVKVFAILEQQQD
jgi:predicted RecB family nuclease